MLIVIILKNTDLLLRMKGKSLLMLLKQAKMYLKQFFGIEIEPEYKFKPFDKVLVRDTEDDDWHVSLFVRKIADAQYKEERYECLNGTGWIYCIPYEGNEHLL